jgi:putative peptidoglycan lipid II flippase
LRKTLSQSSVHYLISKGSVITLITLISRPLGYVREAIQAYLFGATLLVDAFVISFNFPEMVQTLFFSGATSAFLIPVCSRYLHDQEEFSKVYSLFLNLAILVTLALSLLLFLASDPVVRLIAPGFGPDAREIARYLFIIMIPVIPFHAMLSVMKACLNTKEHFAAPELSGILWNLVFIIAALTLTEKVGIYSLAIGVSVGAFGQVLLQVPYLRRHGVHYSMTLPMGHPSVKEAGRLFTGALIATSIVPINSFVGRIIASYLPSGEVASLAYAFRIFILPFSLFAVPTYTVLFSKISRLYHEEDWQGIKTHVETSLVLICVTLIPSTIFLCLAGDALVKILYERGAFTARDTVLTYRALLGYSAGLAFYALSLSFVRIFNAWHDMRTPALIGLTSILLNGILAYLLMRPLGNLGIALATSVVSFYNFMMLFLIYTKKAQHGLSQTTRREITRALVAGAILVIILLILRHLLTSQPYMYFVAAVLASIVVYGAFFKDYYMTFLRRGKR